MKILTLVMALGLVGCSSTPTKKEIVNENVFQCARLCAAGTVTMIKELDCVCYHDKRQPIINNVIMPQAQNYTPAQPQAQVIYQTAPQTAKRALAGGSKLFFKHGGGVEKVGE